MSTPWDHGPQTKESGGWRFHNRDRDDAEADLLCGFPRIVNPGLRVPDSSAGDESPGHEVDHGGPSNPQPGNGPGQ